MVLDWNLIVLERGRIFVVGVLRFRVQQPLLRRTK